MNFLLILSFLYLFFQKLSPIIFYFLAYSIPNQKWLKFYGIFWIILYISTFARKICLRDPTIETNYNIFIIVGWTVLGLIIYSSGAAIVGTLAKAFVFYQKSKDHEVNMAKIQLFGLLVIIFILPLIGKIEYYLLEQVNKYFCQA